MRYWDSSALLPLTLGELKSAEIRSILENDSLIVSWWGTPVECFSGILRRKWESVFSEAEFQKIRVRLDHLIGTIDFVVPSNPLRERAIRLLSLHRLRAGDVFQLAAALQWCRDQTRGVGFVCLDERLRSAALAEGFKVLP